MRMTWRKTGAFSPLPSKSPTEGVVSAPVSPISTPSPRTPEKRRISDEDDEIAAMQPLVMSRSTSALPDVTISLRSSSTSSPVSNASSAPSTPPPSAIADLSLNDPMPILDASKIAPELTARHIVQLKPYALNQTLLAPLGRRDDMVNMEPVYEMLDRMVGKPLVHPLAAPCRSAVMACTGPARSGARTAVEVWCATNRPRVNVIVYKWSTHEEVNRDFFAKLMMMAAANSPCVLVIHRITERAPPDYVAATFVALWQAYLRYSEEKIRAIPPFWLMFIDQFVPSQVLDSWQMIRAKVALPDFSRPEVLLQSMIQQELRRLFGQDDEQTSRFAEFYRPIAGDIVRQNPNVFQHTTDVIEYVLHLFGLPSQRKTVDQVRMLSDTVSVGDILPQPSDFDVALEALMETKRQAEQDCNERNRAHQDRQEQQKKERLRQLTGMNGNR